jgi:hypothetical protein
MLCFPVGFFWAAMYTESLFLALAIGAFVLFERQQWYGSAVCAFLAVLTRPTGLILAPCLLALAIRQSPAAMEAIRKMVARIPILKSGAWLAMATNGVPSGSSSSLESHRSTLLPFLPVVCIPAAYAMFAIYQWVVFGTPMATVRADQAAPFSRNFGEALRDITLSRPGFPSWYLAGLLGLGLVFLAAVPLVYRRFGFAYALFAGLAVLFPMSTGLVSLERYVMIDFPVFAALATVRPRLVPVALMAVGFYMCLGLMALFVNGYTII